MKEQLKALYELQKVDLQIAAASRTLAALDDSSQLRAQLAQTEKRLTSLVQELQKTESDIKDKELTLKSVESKKQTFESKMYGGQITNPKELSSLEKEIEMLGKQRAELDEQILALYASIEAQQATVEKVETLVAGGRKRLAEQTAIYESKSKELKTKLDSLNAERQKALANVTDRQLLSKYETVRSRHKDSGLALVVDGKCGGCHVGITQFTVRKLYENQEVQTCESCGRILYLNR